MRKLSAQAWVTHPEVQAFTFNVYGMHVTFHPLICTGLTIFDGGIYATMWGMLDYVHNTDANEKEVWELGILLKTNRTEDRWERVAGPNEVGKAR